MSDNTPSSLWPPANAANTWDRSRAQSEQILNQLVQDHPNTGTVLFATLMHTSMELGSGMVDTLRVGTAVAERGLAGLGQDALRLLGLPFAGGQVAKMGVGAIKSAATAVKPALSAAAQVVNRSSSLPQQAVKAITECPLAQKAAALAAKAKAALGKDIFGRPTPKASELCTRGCPISMITGEEVLTRDDFTWPGPLPLTWTRTYRSSGSGVDVQLGHGWLTPLDEWLELGADEATYHDSEGRRISLPLPTPGESSFNLPEQLRLQQVTDGFLLHPAQGPQRFFQGQHGRLNLAGWRNDGGHRIDLVRDGRGQVLALQASWGRALLVQRVGRRIQALVPAKPVNGRLQPVAAPLVRHEFDENGDLRAALNRLDEGERYAYDQHLIVQRTLASGFNFHFEWDRPGPRAQCRRNWGDGGVYDYHFEWLAGGVSRAIDSRGGVTEFHHSPGGQLLRETSPEGHVTRYDHGANGLLAAVTDPQGGITRYEHDALGRLLAVTDALGHTQRLAWDEASRPTRLSDALGQTWQRQYDEQGRLALVKNPAGGSTQFAYNEQGLLAEVQNPVGQTRRLLWDEQARLVGEVGFDGLRRRFQYDDEDRIIAVVTQDQRSTRYEHDPLGRVVAVTTADGATLKLRYDAAGQVTQVTQPDGRITEYRYADGLGQVTERVDPAGHTLRYRYDSQRNLVALVNGKGETHRFVWDKDERLVAQTGVDGRQQRYQFSPAGHLLGHAERGPQDPSDAAWHITRFERDALGQVQRQTAPDGAVTEFSHDAAGRLAMASNAHCSLVRSHSPLGQVASEWQNGQELRHEHDAAGRRVATTTPQGDVIRYRYNERGHLAQLLLNKQPVTRHQYNDFGEETRRQQGALASQFEYDPLGRLQRQLTRRDDAPGLVLARAYGHDTAGRLAAVEDFRAGRTDYHYDPADRLLQVDGAVPERFVHDPANNLVGLADSRGGQPGRVEANRLRLLGDRHYDYDGAGNRVQQRRGTGGQQVTRYHYDGSNRLVQVDTPQGSSHYRYDPLGRRIAKLTPEGETRFLYDGARLLCETGPQRDSVYLYEPEGFRPLARCDRQAGVKQLLYYHLDHLGTPREMTDAQGRVVWSARYRAYGALALADVTLVDNPLRFQGQYHDVETGLHYNLHRYYDPECGSFIHQDPIGLAGGENLYRYAANPVGWVDPLGLTACGEGIGTAGESPLLLPAPRQIEAAWGASEYRHGGLMTGIEHIMYRHGPNSGFANVGRYAQGTRISDISEYVDSALRYGSVTRTGANAYTVEYNLGRSIGTDISGSAASSIRVHVRDGIIQTAFPI
ncbi:RHS repeat-associated core domain protein [Burkholderiales bacterium JOSHI_001]|nr:RHS repeat-associated core domain protein [Burkholderiales bacterium JOSHI_001]